MTYHTPVMLRESIDALGIIPGGCYTDVTFGGGGHSREILKNLGEGRLIGFDQDADAAGNAIDDPRFILVRSNFRHLARFLRFYDALPIDGILADLGVSSYQIDKPEKGFSTRFEGMADMRMDASRSTTAADLLNEMETSGLASLFREYGELPNAGRIASAIARRRESSRIETTTDLKQTLMPLAPKGSENKFFARVFQALRIEVNDEIGALKELLQQSARVLKPGGRLVVISYHSLEDRLVKNFMRSGNFGGEAQKDLYGNLITPFQVITRKPLEAGEDEVLLNPRARSAKLRIARKL